MSERLLAGATAYTLKSNSAYKLESPEGKNRSDFPPLVIWSIAVTDIKTGLPDLVSFDYFHAIVQDFFSIAEPSLSMLHTVLSTTEANGPIKTDYTGPTETEYYGPNLKTVI